MKKAKTSAASLAVKVTHAAELKKDVAPQKLETKYTWDDIVIPPDHLIRLKELCSQAKNQLVKRSPKGKGIFALFTGQSGTGKTMAAQIIANELKLDLYKVDLSKVISKYIGETEKNLKQIFAAIENMEVVLFFDEADTLFGKRTEVKDSHDRYANLEISYLLQRIENHPGLVILSTNIKSSLNQTFLRHIHFHIKFPIEHRKGNQD